MLKQYLQQKLQQKLSPQQIQLMKLIQLPTQVFEQRIKQELEENPALEGGKGEKDALEEILVPEVHDDYDIDDANTIPAEDINVDEYLSDDEIPGYRLHTNNYSEEEEKKIPYASGVTFFQYLKSQLNTFVLSEQEREIADFMIGNIDESGYIRRDLTDIMDDLAFIQNIATTEETLKKLLKIIQQLDPPGVGAQNLQECLLIQLRQKKQTASIILAIEIVDHFFDYLIKKHYKKLLKKFDISEVTLRSAIAEIERLNPKPGNAYSGNTRITEHIIPDFTIEINEDELELTLNARNAPELHVSREYANMMEAYKNTKEKSRSQKETILFIKQKLDSARWFIDAIRQRQQTLLLTMNAIMNYQKKYFLSGDERKLRPMILKDIAERIDMDVSTVSRVANSKYVSTPYGTKLIKDFFSESMKNDQGEDVSTREIKKILQALIEDEKKGKPLTDEKLTFLLKERGYPIARRTVAKYREQMAIPVARLRKKI